MNSIPEYLLNKYFNKHDKCTICDSFERLYGRSSEENLCNECFQSLCYHEFIIKNNKRLDNIKNERLVKNELEIIKTKLEKGWCPISLRR